LQSLDLARDIREEFKLPHRSLVLGKYNIRQLLDEAQIERSKGLSGTAYTPHDWPSVFKSFCRWLNPIRYVSEFVLGRLRRCDVFRQ
jgi:hypothetical protein